MDNLRVFVIGGVVGVHTATAYVVDVADWYDDDERTTSELSTTLGAMPAFFAALFALTLVPGGRVFSAQSIAIADRPASPGPGCSDSPCQSSCSSWSSTP